MTSKKYTPQEIARLILICLHQDVPAQQKAELHDWLEENEENRQFYESLKSMSKREAGLQEYLRYDSRKDWQRVKIKRERRRKYNVRRLLPYAAVFFLLIGTIWIIQNNEKKMPAVPIAQNQVIESGSAKAQLILENGEKIDLTTAGEQLCRKLEGENFVNDGKLLAYDKEPAQAAVRLHTLKIPRGGEYKVVLADGTRVWLNAESELIYTDRFVGETRKVTLRGEAYFEVAKDKTKPFYVVVGDMEVKVLGTSFNVSAYPGKQRQTTLVEGRVAVDLNQQHAEILPGQQVTETPEGLIVKQVNVANYIAWKERRFVYEDKLLGEVLEDLQRWYDVEVFIVNDEIRNFHLTANLPKYENMDKVLEMIEYAAGVKFEIKGRTVVVKSDR